MRVCGRHAGVSADFAHARGQDVAQSSATSFGADSAVSNVVKIPPASVRKLRLFDGVSPADIAPMSSGGSSLRGVAVSGIVMEAVEDGAG